MLSTASAIDATLYGSARTIYIISKSRELPAQLQRPIWNHPIEGLLITSVSKQPFGTFVARHPSCENSWPFSRSPGERRGKMAVGRGLGRAVLE